MKAALVTQNGVEMRDVPAPVAERNQVLVRVRACALNRADLAVAAGHKHGAIGGPGTIVGMEFAGEVAEVAPRRAASSRVTRDVLGRRGLRRIRRRRLGARLAHPANMSFEQAATLPVALMTMHNALVTAGRLAAGESVLIQGASSGVGLMALQIAKHMGAGFVIGTSTNAMRRGKLAQFGADLALDTADPAWPDAVLAATGGKGVHLIIDQVSASVANANMRAARVLGRIVNVGRLGGAKGEFDYDLHALKRIAYIGVTFRTRSAEEVREINRRMRADLWGAIEAGKLRLPLDRSFPLAEAAAALAYMRANAHFGKIVLSV